MTTPAPEWLSREELRSLHKFGFDPAHPNPQQVLERVVRMALSALDAREALEAEKDAHAQTMDELLKEEKRNEPKGQALPEMWTEVALGNLGTEYYGAMAVHHIRTLQRHILSAKAVEWRKVREALETISKGNCICGMCEVCALGLHGFAKQALTLPAPEALKRLRMEAVEKTYLEIRNDYFLGLRDGLSPDASATAAFEQDFAALVAKLEKGE